MPADWTCLQNLAWSFLGLATEEGASFIIVVRKAAEILDLQLPSIEVKLNVLTEVHQPELRSVAPLLPFNESLVDILLEAWTKPCAGVPVHRTILQPAPGDPAFLTQHPTPESLVVQASATKVNPSTFHGTPPDR